MILLAKAVGGTRVFIPGTVGKSHWLVKVIGLEDARKLSDHFAVERFTKTEKYLTSSGTFLDIPLAPKPKPSADPIIHKLSARTAAKKLGVTMRTIHRRRSVARREGER